MKSRDSSNKLPQHVPPTENPNGRQTNSLLLLAPSNKLVNHKQPDKSDNAGEVVDIEPFNPLAAQPADITKAQFQIMTIKSALRQQFRHSPMFAFLHTFLIEGFPRSEVRNLEMWIDVV